MGMNMQTRAWAIAIFHAILVATCHGESTPNKPALDDKALRNWPDIDYQHTTAISGDGGFVSYQVATNSTGSKLIVTWPQDPRGRWGNPERTRCSVH